MTEPPQPTSSWHSARRLHIQLSTEATSKLAELVAASRTPSKTDEIRNALRTERFLEQAEQWSTTGLTVVLRDERTRARFADLLAAWRAVEETADATGSATVTAQDLEPGEVDADADEPTVAEFYELLIVVQQTLESLRATPALLTQYLPLLSFLLALASFIVMASRG